MNKETASSHRALVGKGGRGGEGERRAEGCVSLFSPTPRKLVDLHSRKPLCDASRSNFNANQIVASQTPSFGMLT